MDGLKLAHAEVEREVQQPSSSMVGRTSQRCPWIRDIHRLAGLAPSINLCAPGSSPPSVDISEPLGSCRMALGFLDLAEAPNSLFGSIRQK